MSTLQPFEVECYFPGDTHPELVQVAARHVQHAREEARTTCEDNGWPKPCRMIVSKAVQA